MKRSNDRILTTHVGSLIRPQPLQAFLRAKQAGKPFDAKRLRELPDPVGRRHRSPASRGRHRRYQRRRIREIDQLVAIRARALERLRAPSGQARRQSVSARRRSQSASPSSMPSLTRTKGSRPGLDAVCIGPDRLYRAGGARARHRQFQGRARRREGRGGVPAGRRARERHPGPQERILQERRGVPHRDRRRRCARNTR